MSYMSEERPDKMAERIAALELALQHIATARRQLCRNTAEVYQNVWVSVSACMCICVRAYIVTCIYGCAHAP